MAKLKLRLLLLKERKFMINEKTSKKEISTEIRNEELNIKKSMETWMHDCMAACVNEF
jgi:hypothetical protein